MKRYTIAEIAAANNRAGGHYFDRDTLKFFGQTRRMFRAIHKAARVFVYAAHYGQGKFSVGYSFAEFHPATGRLSPMGLTTRSMRQFLEDTNV